MSNLLLALLLAPAAVLVRGFGHSQVDWELYGNLYCPTSPDGTATGYLYEYTGGGGGNQVCPANLDGNAAAAVCAGGVDDWSVVENFGGVDLGSSIVAVEILPGGSEDPCEISCFVTCPTVCDDPVVTLYASDPAFDPIEYCGE